MQVTVHFHHFLARAQPEVESVTEQNLCAGLFHFFRGHPFYRAVSTHGHKRRGLHCTAFKNQLTTTGITVFLFQFKF
ncbi:Uncharacterised protein [Vibrio cholerae]|nr:Uncharacterised protein [Vibrio cholerae]